VPQYVLPSAMVIYGVEAVSMIIDLDWPFVSFYWADRHVIITKKTITKNHHIKSYNYRADDHLICL